jgi:hypothetical protein
MRLPCGLLTRRTSRQLRLSVLALFWLALRERLSVVARGYRNAAQG